jgi:UDP-N-acetylmuramate: L-alanyl-gamma-D-glutamyl-meso-diaminopimelate ligase
LAIKNQFERKKIIVCLELHTYSSLDLTFINQYANSLDSADEAIIFYDPETLRIKNRAPILQENIEQGFGHSSLQVFTQASQLQTSLLGKNFSNVVLVMMSSGNFGGINWGALRERFL